MCDNCVLKFDHHCELLSGAFPSPPLTCVQVRGWGTCVGANNYRWFVWFVSLVTLDCLATFVISLSVRECVRMGSRASLTSGAPAFGDADGHGDLC